MIHADDMFGFFHFRVVCSSEVPSRCVFHISVVLPCVARPALFFFAYDITAYL